jgi:hypothetical protein
MEYTSYLQIQPQTRSKQIVAQLTSLVRKIW